MKEFQLPLISVMDDYNILEDIKKAELSFIDGKQKFNPHVRLLC